MKHLFQFFLFLLSVNIALPHPGGVDQNGGHTDQRTGQYHYHGNPGRKVAPEERIQSKTREPSLSETEVDLRIQEYFRKSNAGLANKPLGTLHERDVPESIKDAVKRRDGNQCVVCKSPYDLEVDHVVALMNGGDNSMENLATLCDSCHTKKTRLDNSLRRHRQRIRTKSSSP
jgi:hypothetical protein